MAGYYTESNYENAVLQLLNEGLGYTYVYGPDVERDYHSPLYEDVLLPACSASIRACLWMLSMKPFTSSRTLSPAHCCKRT